MKLSATLLIALATAACAAPVTVSVDVDAREISRSLLHARIELPASPAYFFPKWIPGVHAPGGPVENIGGLRFETAKGEVIPWQRDDEELHRFIVNVPPGTDRVIARLDYICNQPSVNSSGVDSFGNSLLGVINWNTVLLYPENAVIDTATAAVRVQLPDGWRFGTALKPEKEAVPGSGAPIQFQAATLRTVVDSPLICGANFRDIDLTGKATPPITMHLVSEAGAAIQIDDKLIARYRALAAEAVALFGVAHFPDYHFLVVCSDQVPNNGLEHLCSSFNAVNERDLVDEKKRKLWPAYLLPHEFVHSWCGKYRRPAAMVTTNFHTPERTRLLWIYEGLTQYLGEVLTVRSGLLTQDEYLTQIAGKIDWLMRQAGRQWRSVDDTARSSWKLRGTKTNIWSQLRRSQDYYDEGLLVWLEADGLIREKTGGKKSLDDFCKQFFANQRDASAVARYELDEVTGILRGLVADVDWAKFFHDRIEVPRKDLGLEFIEKLGYRIQYSAKPSEYLTERDASRKQTTASASIGITVAEDGSRITSVVPGMPGDKAGLVAGMVISGVNNRKFTAQRLKDAIADSVTNQGVELLILDGDTFRTVKIPYAEGPKYLELVRRADGSDTLGAILKATTKGEK